MVSPAGILVVDDSALSREALKGVLESNPALKVVGEASTGEEAIELVRKLQPALVTMDLNMPGMGGLKAIERIMRERPTPVVVISERSSTASVDLNYEALSRGALELVPKSAIFGAGPNDVRRFVEKIRALVARPAQDDRRPPPSVPAPKPTTPPALLGIGASTGGPRALVKLLSSLGKGFPLPIAVVQHMAEDFFDSFVRFLGDASGLPCEVARPGQRLEPGRVVVGPPRSELFITPEMTVKLLPSPAGAIISPTVDSLFFSMATSLKDKGVGVLLTGMGEDGAQGLLRMRRQGAHTIAQDKASCAVYGMPRAAAELGAAEAVLPLDDMAEWLRGCLAKPRAQPRAEPTRRGVLVLDEDAAVAEATRKALEAEGYAAVAVDNPMVVAGTLRRSKAELVVMESNLATLKPQVVVQALQRNGLGHIPVIFFTSQKLGDAQQLAVATGAKCALAKSSGLAQLAREVRRLLGDPAHRR